MQCATCKQVVRIRCNTCLVCHACFFAGPHPCTEVVNVADDVYDKGENSSVDEFATPRKPDKGRRVAGMQAKLVMATRNGKLRDPTRGALSHCLDVLGVKVPSGSTRRQIRDTAMQLALPCWHSGMPLCRIQTVLPVVQHRQAAPNPAVPNRWMTWIDSSINKMMVPTYLHVPICCFLLCCFPRCRHSFLVFIQFPHFSCSHIFPIFPFWFSMSFFLFL